MSYPDNEDESSFNLNQIITELKKLTPQIVSAVQQKVINPGQGIGYTHWAKGIIYTYGDLPTKAMLSGAQLMMRAHEAAQKRNFGDLQNLCSHPEYYLSTKDSPERYEPAFIEALILTYVITADCLIEAASGKGDYEIASKYLWTALALLTRLQKANPKYKGYLIEALIHTKIHQIEKHLR